MRHAGPSFLLRRGRVLWSLLLLVAALALLVIVRSGRQFRAAPGELGPDFWPQVALVALLLLSALNLVTEMRKAAVPARAAASRRADDWRLVAAGTLAVAAYAVAMTLIGFAPATAIFLVVFAALGGYRNMRALVVTAILTTVALLYVFVQVVYISLPLGQGPFVDLNVLIYRALGIF